MRHIVLDATGFQNFQTGVGRYSYNLITNLVPQADDMHFTILISHTLSSTHPIVRFAHAHSIRIMAIKAATIGPQRDIRFLLPIPRYDLYHCLNSNLPLFLHRRTIVTLHDFMYLKYPQFLGQFSILKRAYLALLMLHVARRASHIIAVSHFLAADFRDYYQKRVTRPLPLTVVHEAATSAVGSTLPSSRNMHTYQRRAQPYFLYYGELRPHKNIDRLITAFRIFQTKIQSNSPVELLIAGSPHPTYLLPDPLPFAIHYLGAADDAMLSTLLPHAIALCFVSLYEAFGLPLLEAMQCGTAIISSKIAAIPEIAGDAALLVDPYNAHAIAHAMYLLYTDKGARDEYIRRGRKRVQQFSWQHAARQTLQIYQSAL